MAILAKIRAAFENSISECLHFQALGATAKAAGLPAPQEALNRSAFPWHDDLDEAGAAIGLDINLTPVTLGEIEMTTRRDLLTAAALLAPLSLGIKTARAKAEQESPKMADFLFVQNARSIAYADGKLTLKGINPVTVMFSDRPERIAGHMATARFVPFWGNGKDSFLKDPPNATLSFLEDEALTDAVVELQDPVLSGEDLSYRVKVLEGEIPARAGLASLFIDIIGMPLTPLSFAGARRRVWRRAVWR